MAEVLTFDSLQVDMRQYLERGTAVDPTVFDQLPRLINLAERQLANALKILGFVNNVTDTMTIGQSVIPKPNRWRDTISSAEAARVAVAEEIAALEATELERDLTDDELARLAELRGTSE